MSKRKILSIVRKVGVGTLCFAGSLAGAYFLTPVARKTISFAPKSQAFEASDDIPENFMRFVTRLNEDTGLMDESVDENNTYYGFKVNFDEFSVAFRKDENSALNTIGLEGQVDLKIQTIKNISFNLDVEADYNGKKVPLEVGYINKTGYFGLYDLRMKVGSTTIDELFGNEEEGIDSFLYQVFMASKEEGGIGFDVESYINDLINGFISDTVGGLLSSIDMSSLSTSLSLKPLEEGEEGIGVTVNEETIEGGYTFDIGVQIRKGEKDTSINLGLTVNDDYRLTRVDLGTIDLGNVVIKGAIDIEAIEDYTIIAPDNPEYHNYKPEYNYVEVINYKGWLQKIAHFIDESNQKFGLDFALDLDQKNKGNLIDIGEINGSISADFSKILDFGKYMGGEGDGFKTASFRDNASLGVDLKIYGQTHEEYSNLSLNYVEGKGYLKLNETEDENGVKKSVIKSRLDAKTMNWVIDELPGMFENISGDGSSNSIVNDLFSFVTDSSLIRGIKDGDYSVVLDMLKTLKNTENTIEIGIDLSTLGFGEEAEVDLVLDSRTGENNRVLNLELSDIEMGSFVLNASVNTTEFTEFEIDDEETYDSLSFLPTVFDQVSGILNTKQTGFSISGSVFDEDHVGIEMNGKGQFDYGKRVGFGDLTIDQYKYKGGNVWYSHKLAVDIDNRSDDRSVNNAHFVYGEKNGKNIKGKVTIQSVLDIIDVAKDFMEDNKDNEKFTKFIDPITKMMAVGELSDIINQKDYFRLLKNDLVKSAKRNDQQLDLVIGGELFNFDHDMVARVNLKDDKLDSLELIDFAISSTKTLNLKIALEDYEADRESSVDKSNLNEFMDLSSIALLLQFGIKTTENNYYHLTAKMNLNLGVIKAFNFQVEVYIVVQDSYCKIYGVIEDAAISPLIQNYNDLVTKAVKSEFTFETYPDGDPNKADGVGGYFHFKVTETRRISGDHIYHYKTTSKNLLKEENIMVYLLRDFLFLSDDVVKLVGNVSVNKDEQAPAGDFTNTFTDTGYSYKENEKKWSIGLNLDELTGINALKELEINIYGNNQEKFSRLEGSMNIEAFKLGSLSATIALKFDVTLEQTNPNISDWSNSIQTRFDGMKSVNFTDEYLNQPKKAMSK